MNIELIAKGFDVAPLQVALKNEELWNLNTARTQSKESPHHGCDDIWARYAKDYLNPGPFWASWYPVARKIPIKPLVNQVMDFVGGKELGGVLITRIPPGESVKPHKDSGWHAQYHNRKFGLSIEANENQAFCYEDCKLVTSPGDLFFFDNSQIHWVTNESEHARITLIICTRG